MGFEMAVWNQDSDAGGITSTVHCFTSELMLGVAILHLCTLEELECL